MLSDFSKITVEGLGRVQICCVNFETVHRRDQLFGDVPTLSNTTNDKLSLIASESGDSFHRRVKASSGDWVGFVEPC